MTPGRLAATLPVMTVILTLLIILFAAILVAAPFVVWAVFRRRGAMPSQGAAAPPVDGAFYERGASGRRRGQSFGARNCLTVAVAGPDLWITPVFPIKLFAPRGDLGLDVRLPKREVISAEAERTVLGTKVVLQVPQASGPPGTIDLYLRAPAAFLAALSAGPPPQSAAAPP